VGAVRPPFARAGRRPCHRARQGSLQERHQIHDLGARSPGRLGGLGLDDHVRLARLHLAAHERHHVVAVFVLELLGIPLPSHAIDELPGHLDLALGDPGALGRLRRHLNLIETPQLVRVAQKIQDQNLLAHKQRRHRWRVRSTTRAIPTLPLRSSAARSSA